MRLLAILMLLLFSLAIPASAEPVEEMVGPEIGKSAPGFVLMDAEEKAYRLEELRGKAVLLIMGNRKLRKDDNLWVEKLLKGYEEEKRLAMFIIADMRSVPRFVPKFLVLNQLRKDKPPTTLLLDWGGKMHQTYRTKLDKPNLCLIDPQGKVTYFRRALHSPDAEDEVRQQIQKVLPKSKQAPQDKQEAAKEEL